MGSLKAIFIDGLKAIFLDELKQSEGGLQRSLSTS